MQARDREATHRLVGPVVSHRSAIARGRERRLADAANRAADAGGQCVVAQSGAHVGGVVGVHQGHGHDLAAACIGVVVSPGGLGDRGAFASRPACEQVVACTQGGGVVAVVNLAHRALQGAVDRGHRHCCRVDRVRAAHVAEVIVADPACAHHRCRRRHREAARLRHTRGRHARATGRLRDRGHRIRAHQSARGKSRATGQRTVIADTVIGRGACRIRHSDRLGIDGGGQARRLGQQVVSAGQAAQRGAHGDAVGRVRAGENPRAGHAHQRAIRCQHTRQHATRHAGRCRSVIGLVRGGDAAHRHALGNDRHRRIGAGQRAGCAVVGQQAPIAAIGQRDAVDVVGRVGRNLRADRVHTQDRQCLAADQFIDRDVAGVHGRGAVVHLWRRQGCESQRPLGDGQGTTGITHVVLVGIQTRGRDGVVAHIQITRDAAFISRSARQRDVGQGITEARGTAVWRTVVHLGHRFGGHGDRDQEVAQSWVKHPCHWRAPDLCKVPCRIGIGIGRGSRVVVGQRLHVECAHACFVGQRAYPATATATWSHAAAAAKGAGNRTRLYCGGGVPKTVAHRASGIGAHQATRDRRVTRDRPCRIALADGAQVGTCQPPGKAADATDAAGADGAQAGRIGIAQRATHFVDSDHATGQHVIAQNARDRGHRKHPVQCTEVLSDNAAHTITCRTAVYAGDRTCRAGERQRAFVFTHHRANTLHARDVGVEQSHTTDDAR